MSAQGNSKKLAALVAVLCLMVLAALGGFAAASRTSASGGPAETVNLAGAQSSASSRTVTIYACLSSTGNLTHVSTTAAVKCPRKSVRVRWAAQSSPGLQPAPAPAKSSSPAPSSPPSKTPSAPATTPVSSPTTPVSSPTTPVSSPTAPVSTPASTTALGNACTTSSNGGLCFYSYAGISGSGVDGGNQTNVLQDIWNPISGASQTLTAFSPGDWSVTANMPATNKAVVSYPDVQQIYTTHANTANPLSGYTSLVGSYTESGPTSSADDYEAAYDIWANNGSQEIMIWVDNHGQRPAGSVVASATIGGAGYQIWSTSGANAVGHPVSMVLDSTQTSGSVNLLADLNWLESNGYMQANSGLNQVDFGWEICSTGGVPATFTMSQYGLKATCTSGSSCIQ